MAKSSNKGFARKDRVNEQIRREVAELIRTELKDPRVGMVSLTDVEVTPDYAHAKVFFTTLAGDDALAEVTVGLSKAAGFLRRELGRRIRIHTIPELHFVHDQSLQRGSSLSQLIDQAVSSQADDAEGEDGGEATDK